MHQVRARGRVVVPRSVGLGWNAMASSHGAPNDNDDDDDDGDWESWAEPEVAPTRCLFTPKVFDSAAECLAHAVSEYGLDLAKVATRCEASRGAPAADLS